MYAWEVSGYSNWQNYHFLLFLLLTALLGFTWLDDFLYLRSIEYVKMFLQCQTLKFFWFQSIGIKAVGVVGNVLTPEWRLRVDGLERESGEIRKPGCDFRGLEGNTWQKLRTPCSIETS